MNERKEFNIGPGAASLMLIVVVLSMSVLGMLAMMNARSDNRLSMRSAEVTEQVYALSAQAERTLAQIDGALADCAAQAADDAEYLALAAAALPQGATLQDRAVRWREEGEDGRSLICAVELAPLGESPRMRWTEHKLYTELEEASEVEETWEIWF